MLALWSRTRPSSSRSSTGRCSACWTSWSGNRRSPSGSWAASSARGRSLVKLRWFGDRDGAVDDVVAALLDDIREHLAFEHELLVRLRRHLPEEDLGQVAVRMSSRAWARPTRPHPDLPASRPLAGLVGFPMALADHLLDVLAFRPTGS